MSIKELVEKAGRGDLRAFEDLLVHYQDRVFSHCLRLTANSDDAQDLAQEVFIQAFRAIKTFRHEADFGTWLHRITVNSWLNWQRRNKKLLIFSLDNPVNTSNGEVIRELAAGEDSPLEAVERQELSAAVRTALDRLAPEYRTVLILREMEGYSYEEIARMLDCSLGTVKSRISRGRRDIKKEIIKLRCEWDEM
ncbi:sigma-70 family RNA polymerase sigma factor [Syntrophomonas wolfei]|nr:sigma-70 family RNA polymerase sigma factor [Syntrophomonas wolfei]